MVNSQTMWIAVRKGVAASTAAGFTEPATILAARAEIRNCRSLDEKRFGLTTTRGLAQALVEQYLKELCGGAKPNSLV